VPGSRDIGWTPLWRRGSPEQRRAVGDANPPDDAIWMPPISWAPLRAPSGRLASTLRLHATAILGATGLQATRAEPVHSFSCRIHLTPYQLMRIRVGLPPVVEMSFLAHFFNERRPPASQTGPAQNLAGPVYLVRLLHASPYQWCGSPAPGRSSICILEFISNYREIHPLLISPNPIRKRTALDVED
jgi:hypothetical protein